MIGTGLDKPQSRRRLAQALVAMIAALAVLVLAVLYREACLELRSMASGFAGGVLDSARRELAAELFSGRLGAYQLRIGELARQIGERIGPVRVVLRDSSERVLASAGESEGIANEIARQPLADLGRQLGSVEVYWHGLSAISIMARYKYALGLYSLLVCTLLGVAHHASRRISSLARIVEDYKYRLDQLERFARKSRKSGGVFISYSHADKKFVQKLAGELSKDAINFWLDSDNVQVGDVIDAAISEGIQENWLFLCVLSPASIGSRWVVRELDEALHEEVVGTKKVLPILLGGLSEEQIPARLRRKKAISFDNDFDNSYRYLVDSIRFHLDAYNRASRVPERA